MKIKIRNTSFEVEPSVHIEFWQSIAQESWEMESYRIIDQYCNQQSVMVDIGAWAGPITLYAASKCKKVYALEPDPAIYPELIKNVALNSNLAPRIICLNKAIAIRDGIKKLYARNNYGESSSSLLQRFRDRLDLVDCECISLTTLLETAAITHIDFIKMDIEGAEFELIKNLKDELKKLNYPSLYISFHFSHLLESILYQKGRNMYWNKFILKLSTWFNYFPYHTAIKAEIIAAISSLSEYKFLYSASGEEYHFEDFLKNPFLIKKGSFLFTNQKWEQHD